jgi:uncharacterized membrane protein
MFRFIKNAIFRGLVILIPIVVIYITLRELLQLMIDFASPIADVFPHGTFSEDDATEIIAILLITLTAFLLGLFWSIKSTRTAGSWVENHTLNKVPMYRMLKSLVAAFLDLEDEKSFKPALLSHADGTIEPVFVIEEHGDDMFVVMQPWTPTPFAGSIKVVARDRIEMISATLDEYSLALTHFGLGLSKAMQVKGIQRDE